MKLIPALLFALSLPAFAETPTATLRPPPSALPMPYTIEFGPGATVDFADVSTSEPGSLRGYVYVKMQGELVVIPVYRPDRGLRRHIADEGKQ